MKHGTTKTIAITMITCLVAGTLVAAESEGRGRQGNGKKFPGAGELKAYRAKQQQACKDYFKERHEENVKFRESLKEKNPAEALPLIISNRKTQHTATKTFMTGLYDDFVTYAKEVFTKHEVPAEKQETFLAKMQEHRDEIEAKHTELYEKLIASLESLQGKEDLTWEDIKETIKANMPDRKGGQGPGQGQRRKRE